MIEELGYQPVRADQDLGGLIIKEMLERLYFAVQDGAVAWKLAVVIKDLEVSVGQQTNPGVKQGLETVLDSLKALL